MTKAEKDKEFYIIIIFVLVLFVTLFVIGGIFVQIVQMSTNKINKKCEQKCDTGHYLDYEKISYDLMICECISEEKGRYVQIINKSQDKKIKTG